MVLLCDCLPCGFSAGMFSAKGLLSQLPVLVMRWMFPSSKRLYTEVLNTSCLHSGGVPSKQLLRINECVKVKPWCNTYVFFKEIYLRVPKHSFYSFLSSSSPPFLLPSSPSSSSSSSSFFYNSSPTHHTHMQRGKSTYENTVALDKSGRRQIKSFSASVTDFSLCSGAVGHKYLLCKLPQSVVLYDSRLYLPSCISWFPVLNDSVYL